MKQSMFYYFDRELVNTMSKRTPKAKSHYLLPKLEALEGPRGNIARSGVDRVLEKDLKTAKGICLVHGIKTFPFR